MYTLQGYDTFEGGDAWYPLDGEYADLSDACVAAYARFVELEAEQPSGSSGGQAGIQDQVWLVHPDGHRERLSKAKLLLWAEERALTILDSEGPLSEAEIAKRL